MKKLLSILALFCFVICAQAQVTTLQLVITNTLGTSNGETITINGTLRFFTNNVTSIVNQILTNNTIVGTQSNIFNAYTLSVAPGVQLQVVSTNQINFISFPGSALTGSVSAGWATIASGAQPLTNLYSVRAPDAASPITVVSQTERTNTETAIIEYINDGLSLATINSAASVMANFGALANSQTWTGSNQFAGLSATNASLLNPNFTNGINQGNAFSSPGVGVVSEQFGAGATATGPADLAVGNGAHATGPATATAIGENSSASGPASTSIGAGATSTGTSSVSLGNNASSASFSSTALGANANASQYQSTAVGTGAAASATNTTAIGQGAQATAYQASAFGSGAVTTGIGSLSIGTGASESGTNAIAIGNNVANTTDNEITIGSGSQYTRFAGNIWITGILSNALTIGGTLTTGGTNLIFGLTCYQSSTSGSLTTGNNADVPTGTNSFVYLSGPSGAFNIVGLAGGYPNREITLVNVSGQVASILHLSGVESTATNRIFFGAGHSSGDAYLLTNMVGAWYDSTSNYWRLKIQ